MKTSPPFFYDFDHEEIQKDNFMSGKYQVTFDHEDNKVYNVYVNTGLDCPQNWEQVDLDLPNRGSKLYQACERHLLGNIYEETK